MEQGTSSGIERPLAKQSEDGGCMTAVVTPLAVDSSRDRADELAFALPQVLWDLVPAGGLRLQSGRYYRPLQSPSR